MNWRLTAVLAFIAGALLMHLLGGALGTPVVRAAGGATNVQTGFNPTEVGGEECEVLLDQDTGSLLAYPRVRSPNRSYLDIAKTFAQPPILLGKLNTSPRK